MSLFEDLSIIVGFVEAGGGKGMSSMLSWEIYVKYVVKI
jgi:hypothetical protein